MKRGFKKIASRNWQKIEHFLLLSWYCAILFVCFNPSVCTRDIFFQKKSPLFGRKWGFFLFF
ncbi:hypothetical protein CSB09_01595 [Candidatus Gracilibacteria bacterium]|nr:MAG: hypothetical protein CSB09_01595 [Candidatus Gracilibacteria bacterium]